MEVSEGTGRQKSYRREAGVIAGEGRVFAKLWMCVGTRCVWGTALKSALPELCWALGRGAPR